MISLFFYLAHSANKDECTIWGLEHCWRNGSIDTPLNVSICALRSCSAGLRPLVLLGTRFVAPSLSCYGVITTCSLYINNP